MILSDIPLDAKVLDDPTPFGLIDLSRAGKLHAIKSWLVGGHDGDRLFAAERVGQALRRVSLVDDLFPSWR